MIQINRMPSKALVFADLQNGETFEFNNRLFRKVARITDSFGVTLNAYSYSDNRMCLICSNEPVKQVRVKIEYELI